MPKIDMSRRLLLGSSLAFGAGAFYWLYHTKESRLEFYAKETQVLLHLAYHLFPHSSLGPGSVDLHISGYLHSVLSDQRIMKEDRDYFIKGGFWLEESAFEMYDKSFLSLSKKEKESLLQKISGQRWAENLIYTSLSYIFEALLSAPVYGTNIEGIGWKWLGHSPGFPQPRRIEEISYGL